MTALINCGECTVQPQHRVNIKTVAKRYGIDIGDTVEVFIKKTNKEEPT